MQRRSRYLRYALFIAIVLILGWLSVTQKIEYRISSKAFFMPASEYGITRNVDGNLISTLTDHHTHLVERYSITEFQRGDVVELIMSTKITNNGFITAGDTIGYIISNEEQRNLIDLQGQLDVLKAELLFFTTGQKPEDVLLALNQLELAKQELETERLLMERSERIFSEGAISRQEYDIALNTLKVRELAVKIAQANWESISTGEKPEQEQLTLAQIAALSKQIDQIKQRIQSLTITSPVGGKLIMHRDLQLTGQIITIADTSALIALIPIPVKERSFMHEGSKVVYSGMEGSVSRLDNAVKMIGSQQAFYITATFPWSENLMPGYTGNVTIYTDSITPLQYLARLFGISKIPMT
jgi:multidrug efflux pump subunit AcrA (membrane-fusion protein)